ncbi:MAG: PQQ-binding-like beta-propeller repeat protein, partial [Pirellulales bacterium]
PLRPQPPTWLAYPDTDVSLADVRARLALVSIRTGKLDRAALELDAFRRWHPDAAGRFGGQDGPYTAALEKLLASAKEWPVQPPDRNWPTFAGAQSRSPNAAPVGPLAKTAWATTIALSARENPRPRVAGIPTNHPPDVQVRESERALSCFPVVVDGLLLYADATTVSAVSLATGKPAITPDGTLFRVEATAGDTNAAMLRSRYVAAGVPRFSLTVIDGIAYARVGQVTTARIQAGAPSPVGERLLGIDLKRDGLLMFQAKQAKPDGEGWSFDGTPVGDGRRVYVAMRHGDVTPHVYVACFNVATGNPLWRTSIGSADTPAGGNGDEITHNLLSLVGDRIYFNTNLGLVASLDVEDGRIQWLHRYERRADMSTAAGAGSPLHFDRDPSPCLVHEGLVIVAPSDTPLVFALDADTGHLIWSNDKLADALHLLGVAGDSLIVTGNRFCSLDVRTGRVRFAWPESEHAGIRGMGRGALAGNEVFWPTRKDIYFFDARTGARTRPPIDLSSVSESGANLVIANGYLIVAGREQLTAAGPSPAQPSDKTNQPPKVAKSN